MARTIPLRRIAPMLLRDPLEVVDRIGALSEGRVVRLNLGGMRPWLVTGLDDLEHVLIRNKDNYVRDGWLWRPLSRLIGDAAGDRWWARRDVFARLVSGRSIRAHADQMAATVTAAVDEMAARGAGGAPLDAGTEMTRLVHRIVTRVLIGDKLTGAQADLLGARLRAASASVRPRLLFPFVPDAMPFFGDRGFRRARRGVDDLVLPLVRAAQRSGPDGPDLVSRLLEARMPGGRPLTLGELRDGLVSLFVASTQTPSVAMSFLWTVLHGDPAVKAALQDEVDRVVGDGPLTGAHLSGLTRARNTALEMLRLYPPGWMLPRMIVDDDVIGGVPVRGGGLIVLSPYLTNRLPQVWERPLEFDPSRHERGAQRHALAHLTFGGGPHACVGKPFFLAEAQLIIAAVLSRFRLEVQGSPSPRPALGLALRPRENATFVLSER